MTVCKAAKCISSLLCQSPENKRYMRSEMGIIQELANQLLKEQGTVVHPTLGILVRISPQRPQDLNQFAKQLFCGALVPPFLRVAPERFMTDAREFILAVQATKPDALFGWTLRSDSVQITSYSKAEFRVCYVDFNLLNLQCEKSSVPFSAVFSATVNAIPGSSSSIQPVDRIHKALSMIDQRNSPLHSSKQHQNEKSSVPLSAAFSTAVNATASLQPNNLIQNALTITDYNNSPSHASETNCRLNTNPAPKPTEAPTDSGNKENVPSEANQGLLSQGSKGRNSNPTVGQWLDSVESRYTPETEPEGDMEVLIRSASRLLDSAPGNCRGIETFNNEECLHQSRAPAHAQSTPATPLPGVLLDLSLRQQFLASLNLLGQAMFDQIEQRIQDSLLDKDSLIQRLERKVDEAVESRVQEEFLKVSRTIEAVSTRDKHH
ncbi:hypothetical protein BGZ93_004168 [Podila epicladia]|nr:hypothetical protein BGZ93_004168 [Podila epicladia]